MSEFQRRLEEKGPRLAFTMMDIRDFDAKVLAGSPSMDDRILSVPCAVDNPAETARNVFRENAGLTPPQRGEAPAKPLILSGLKRLHDVLRQEVRRMPLFNHPMDNPFLREL